MEPLSCTRYVYRHVIANSEEKFSQSSIRMVENMSVTQKLIILPSYLLILPDIEQNRLWAQHQAE